MIQTNRGYLGLLFSSSLDLIRDKNNIHMMLWFKNALTYIIPFDHESQQSHEIM